MKTNMKKYIIISTIGIIMFYLIFVFVKLEFNPIMWSEDSRVVFVATLIGLFIITPMIGELLNEIKNK